MYTLSYPSNTLRKDGVVIAQNDSDPAYADYLVWLAADNGPDIVQDAPAPPVTVTAAQFAAAMVQLNLPAITVDELAGVFYVAVGL